MDATVDEAARKANDHPAVEAGARLGYAASGVLHLLIAWIGLQLVLHEGVAASADQSGALSSLAGNGLGRALLWVILLGFALLGLWQVTEVFLQRQASGKVKAVAKTVTYVVLAVTTGRYAVGAGGRSGADQSADLTRTLMQQAFGRLLVAVVGLVVLGVGAYHVYKGWKRRFLADLEEHPGRPAEVAGRYGYVAKGVALGVVGVLFALAALHADPAEARGLDGALHTILEAPGGQTMLAVVSLGIAAYGVYSFFRARHARV
ncbi:DUF1206 domain-containing protein [Lapillicoccus jejuensis]|uniref:Uncharacterized protein DUF1206 n=1 Tax=Lapillicoccus jejuensis TaxID=402171 RepID=A0A542DWV5_9MICO|nr:DUF1206 domain-containing protein [Lapillicoccus jejuensis]TQJ07563.1 uncharacterized protein DUF1206 [Lapillicoccus jejuensis]